MAKENLREAVELFLESAGPEELRQNCSETYFAPLEVKVAGMCEQLPPWKQECTDWKSVDTQADLDELNEVVSWEHSETIEFYGKMVAEPYFPFDTCEIGGGKHIHVLCRICGQGIAWAEIVFIACGWVWPSFLDHLHFNGKVQSRHKVLICDENKSTLLQCSRLIYRFLTQEQMEAVTPPGSAYFHHCRSIT